MNRLVSRQSTPIAILALLAACAPAATTPPGATPAPAANEVAPPLPTIPLATGPLAIKVQYPSKDALIEARDSNFILGGVGDGRASLTINGFPSRVWPNGSFIAFLPMPPVTAPFYDLVATVGADTQRLRLPIRMPPARVVFPPSGAPIFDSASATPRGTGTALRDSEMVRVSVRAAANANVWLDVADRRIPLVSGAGALAIAPPLIAAAVTGGTSTPPPTSTAAKPAPPGSPTERQPGPPATPPAPIPTWPTAAPAARIDPRYLGNAEQWSTDVPAVLLRRGGTLVAARGTDTGRVAIAAIAEPRRMLAVLGGTPPTDTAAANDTDRVVIGRPAPTATYKWMLLPGTVVEMTGHDAGATRVRLDSDLEVWTDDANIAALPAGATAPRRTVGVVRLLPSAEWVDVIFPINARPPYLIEEHEHDIDLTMYGTTASPEIMRYEKNDSLVRFINWIPDASDRTRFHIELTKRPYGYLVFYDSRGFVLRLRRAPKIDRARPLAGLVIAVDPGHPPIGATGPTGLWEPQATLPVGFVLKQMLEAAGATVIMTRTTPDPVALNVRTIIARRAGAHALVSIHYNAVGDGINPFVAQGTSTLFFHPQTEPLARAVQRGLIRRMGLPDLGVHYQNIAIGRATWFPSLICEGAFLMMPDQEYAARTPEFQARYARGIVEGLSDYFASWAR